MSASPAGLFQTRHGDDAPDIAALKELAAFITKGFNKISSEIQGVSDRVARLENLVVPLLNFGEGSPYNADAIKVAKALLANFQFLPTDKEILDVAPQAFSNLLEIETTRKQFLGYVSTLSRKKERKKERKQTACLLLCQVRKKMAGLRSELKIGILVDCDKETIEVFKRWQRVCGVKSPNPPAEQTLHKLTELRVNLAAIAINKTKDPWDVLARDWQALGDGEVPDVEGLYQLLEKAA